MQPVLSEGPMSSGRPNSVASSPIQIPTYCNDRVGCEELSVSQSTQSEFNSRKQAGEKLWVRKARVTDIRNFGANLVSRNGKRIGEVELEEESIKKVLWNPVHSGARIPEVLSTITVCGSLLESWNIRKRRELSHNIKIQRDALKEACKVDKPASWKVISKLEHQLDQALSIEERYWHQRARIEWLQNGDRNTRFFHSKATARRSRNRINGLFSKEGVWVVKQSEMEEVITQYFEGIFTSSEPTEAEIQNVMEGVNAKLESHNVCVLNFVHVGADIKKGNFPYEFDESPRKRWFADSVFSEILVYYWAGYHLCLSWNFEQWRLC
ncbi:hypothetical protein LWI28_001407 [Acer negundo]|uniref:Reverse transcriptase n=1 Tax=Acer negundo TaxID=4023 RepID=A0AAD5II48_ACENE|nr:hypothetical protein LWI28_001407 [Acer negundo]